MIVVFVVVHKQWTLTKRHRIGFVKRNSEWVVSPAATSSIVRTDNIAVCHVLSVYDVTFIRQFVVLQSIKKYSIYNDLIIISQNLRMRLLILLCCWAASMPPINSNENWLCARKSVNSHLNRKYGTTVGTRSSLTNNPHCSHCSNGMENNNNQNRF